MSENSHAPHQVTVEVGGRPLILETGKMAKQANGAIVARYGDTVVLTTACMASEANERDFLPLTVDYRENTYSAGKIPGGFFKREGRPSEKEILTSRLIDRPLRPLFPEAWRNETQIVSLVLSADSDNDPDTGASAACYASDLPFGKPIACVRVGLLDGQLVANPTVAQQKKSLLNIIIAGTEEAIVMVESGALEVSEETVADALEFGHAQIKKIVAAIQELHGQLKPKKVAVEPLPFDEGIYKDLQKKYGERLHDALNTQKHPKKESYHLVDALKEEILATIPEEPQKEMDEKRTLTKRAFERLRENIFRDDVLNARRRPDGRAFDQIRQITCEVGLLPRVHGSALFTRGETQALATLTLGTKEDMQRLDLLFEQDQFKRFMLHYNFPPFSVGEVKFLRGPGRREIGHGALAERALLNLLPPEADFPYAMRLVSDILESNGSSSMATVCGGSLALMDAGVPIKSSCAGIAMGLVVGDKGKYSILTDIAGAEDHYGDMDFKVAGTRNGITALQMDIKVLGISINMMREALAQAKKARLQILDTMEQTLNTARTQISAYAPRLYKLSIPTDKIRDLIGPGGKKIKSITEQTGVKIDVLEDGTVHIFSTSGASGDAALAMVREVTASAEVAKTYLGKVVRLAEFGAFVELFPGTDGLLHISEISEHRIRDVRDELKLGDQVLVKVLSIEGNKIRLSRKALLKEAREKQQKAAAGGHNPGPSGGEGGSGGNSGSRE